MGFVLRDNTERSFQTGFCIHKEDQKLDKTLRESAKQAYLIPKLSCDKLEFGLTLNIQVHKLRVPLLFL